MTDIPTPERPDAHLQGEITLRFGESFDEETFPVGMRVSSFPTVQIPRALGDESLNDELLIAFRAIKGSFDEALVAVFKQLWARLETAYRPGKWTERDNDEALERLRTVFDALGIADPTGWSLP